MYGFRLFKPVMFYGQYTPCVVDDMAFYEIEASRFNNFSVAKEMLLQKEVLIALSIYHILFKIEQMKSSTSN